MFREQNGGIMETPQSCEEETPGLCSEEGNTALQTAERLTIHRLCIKAYLVQCETTFTLTNRSNIIIKVEIYKKQHPTYV
jgi:hypothetical protein